MSAQRQSLAELAGERALLERELRLAKAERLAATSEGERRQAEAWHGLLASAWAETEGEVEARRQEGS